MARKQPVPFGKYLLLDRINVGGMAEVWRGKTLGMGGVAERLVAVKRILPNIAEDEEFVTMFMDEAKITVQLSHANIAQIYDFSFERTHNSYFIAMEYIAGKDLRALFDKCRKLGTRPPVPLVCYVIGKVCDALDYAHRKKDSSGRDLNVVHRDVSPQNIIISYEGDVKVIDFGVAKAAGKANRTQAGILKGKFSYMSPEQVRAEEVDRRSDVFAIGICLYEMLTAERLFTGESDFDVLDKVRTAEIPLPSRLNPEVPEALETIVFKALARDVNVRYQHASELSEDLQRYLITSNTLFSRKDLAAYMKSFFAEDVEKERARMAEYADMRAVQSVAPLSSPPSPRGSLPNLPAMQAGTASDERTYLSPGGPEGSAPRNTTETDSAPSGREDLATPSGAVNSYLFPTEPVSDEDESKTAQLPGGTGVPTGRPGWSGVLSGLAGLGGRLRWPRVNGVAATVLAAVGLAAILASVGVLVSAHGGASSLVCVVVPPPLQGKARVRINGEDLGVPKSWPVLHPVGVGAALVSVSADGFIPFEKEVEVRSTGKPPVVQANLVPQVEQARLVVATTPPDAEIRLDRRRVRPLGERDFFLGDLPVGREVQVEVSAPGFKPFVRSVRAASAADAQIVKAELEPSEEEYQVRISSRPSNASVWFHGQLMGRTPLSLKSPGGSVVLKQRCYADKQEPLPPSQGNGVATLHVDLRRLPSCR